MRRASVLATHRRRGFTLVELLVVVAIIGILIGMLLPGIQHMRETARRTACANNMLQVALALQQYESAFECLPPGSTDAGGPIQNVPQGQHLGWLAHLLPYLEQGGVFKKIDFSQGAYDPANAAAAAARVAVLECPSEPNTGGGSGMSSYAGCHHDVEAPIAEDNHGVLYLNSGVRYADIADGRAHTIFFGERLIPPTPADLGWMSGSRATLRNTGTPLLGRESPAAIAPPADPAWVGGFGSWHPQGANIAFGDGQVRFLSRETPPSILQPLGHRADGGLPHEF